MSVPRVEALCTSTLGYKIATPTELPGVRTIHDGLTISIAPKRPHPNHHTPHPNLPQGEMPWRRPVSPAQCLRGLRYTFPLKKVGNGLSLASLQVSHLAVGMILNLIIASYPFLFIFLLQVTPTANRNSYRVAILVGAATQGRGATRLNPGLGKRNSYRVARGAYHQLWVDHT